MQEINFIIRQPVIDAKQGILGYELSWQHHGNEAGGAPNAADLRTLVDFMTAQLGDASSTSELLSGNLLFLQATPALLAEKAFCTLPPPPPAMVLMVNVSDLEDAGTFSAIKALREQGFGILLRDVDLTASSKPWLPYATHLEMSCTAADFATQIQSYQAIPHTVFRMVARQVANWETYHVCAEQGLDAFIGQLYLTPPPSNRSKGLNPAQTMILQLMEMVRKNADIKQLEGILKRDAALSYRLLRYINSAGFGLGCEIQSLRHAVTMLGYSPLYKWLAVLLATASTSGYSPVLMQTAAIRGQFVELLGQAFLPKNEAENLFVTGMFSLLDRLLGIPMEVVLDNVQLSEPVSQALLSREGIYGSFLAIAEACEENTARVQTLADASFVNAKQVNQAHLSALAWAHNLKL